MATLITVLIVLAFVNLWRCLRFAYTSARDLNSGGYPIYGDAVQNGIFIGLAAFLAGQSLNWYSPYQRPLAWLAIGVFILNVWLIGCFSNAGERVRIRTSNLHDA